MSDWNRIYESCKNAIGKQIEDLFDASVVVDELSTKVNNMYTKDQLIEVMNLGMTLRQDQLTGHSDKSGVEVLNKWIEQNKNK